MKRSEYKKVIREMLYAKLSEGCMVDELVDGIEQANNRLGILPPEIKVSFRTTNGKNRISYVNKWELEA